MKILEANAGPLANYEVLNFLKSKGASKDPTRVLADVAPSEYKVYDYLVETAACNQTEENVGEFLEKCEKYDLAKAEVLNIINIRPSTAVEIYSIIEHCDMRLGEAVEELVEMATEVLPAPPTEPATEEVNNEADKKTVDQDNNEQQVDEDLEKASDKEPGQTS